MTQAIIQVSTTNQLFPIATIAGKLRISVTGQPDQDVDGTSAAFDLPAGDYTATAQRLDASGNAIGAPVSLPFNVPATEIGIDVPASITVTLS